MPDELPPAPRNVSVTYDDGTVQPLELAYRGVDDSGIHCWRATVVLDRAPQAVSIETMPERTQIVVDVGPLSSKDWHVTGDVEWEVDGLTVRKEWRMD